MPAEVDAGVDIDPAAAGEELGLLVVDLDGQVLVDWRAEAAANAQVVGTTRLAGGQGREREGKREPHGATIPQF